MAKKRWLFKYLGVFLFFCLGAISTILSPMPCLGVETATENSIVFSLDAYERPLGEVLQQISKATSYEITIDDEYWKLPTTVSLKNVTVEEGLRRIFGKLNRYMVIDETEKKISVHIVDVKVKKTMVTSFQGKVDSLDVEVIPPRIPGEKGTTGGENQASQLKQKETDPLDMQVLPPMGSGQGGMTVRELKGLEAQQKPKAVGVIPLPVLKPKEDLQSGKE